MSASAVTVVVVVKDRRQEMLDCLEAILAQAYEPFDVLILDNGSTDGTPEACREMTVACNVPVAVHAVAGPLGRARNTGTSLATGEILAFTDSDCRPDPGWLSAGTRPFEQSAVGVVTGATLPETPPPYRPWHATIEITEQTWRFETCNAFFRREALLATEGFLETVSMWEDTSAGWGLLTAGWEARFVPDAIVHHTVTYPPYVAHLRRVHRYGEGAAVIRRYPHARERLLWARYFHRRRDAVFFAALLGLVLAPLSRRALWAALPYAWMRRPRSFSPREPVTIAKVVGIDISILAGMLRGSLRFRRLML